MQGDTPISSGQALMARFILEAKQLQLKMELAEDTVVVTLGSCPKQSDSQSHGCPKN